MSESVITSSVTNWFLVLAIIGLCMMIIYETWTVLQINWLIPPSDYPNILFVAGLVLVGLGLHALYLIYTRNLCKIASWAYIIVPLAFVPAYISRNIVLITAFGTVGISASWLVGAMAFHCLRGEGTRIFRITSVLVLLGALSGVILLLLAFALSSNVPFSFGPLLRTIMWISMIVTFTWVYRNR